MTVFSKVASHPLTGMYENELHADFSVFYSVGWKQSVTTITSKCKSYSSV